MSTLLEREAVTAPADGMRRVGTALAMILAPWGFVVANACYAVATRHGGSDETGSAALALVRSEPTLMRVAVTAAMIGCVLITPAILGAMALTRIRANRLGFVAGALMIGGYVAYFGVAMSDLTMQAMAARGGPMGDYAAVLDAASNATTPWFVLFAAGNLLGTLLLGIALLRARTAPVWAGAALCCWPVLHVTGLIAGTEWFEVAGAVIQAAGFAALAVRHLRNR